MAKKEAKTFAEAVANINSANKKWKVLSFGDPSRDLKKLPLKSLPIDLSFKGGLPYGQLVTVSGVEHSGKSSYAAAMMARYQEENPGKVCLWIDGENTLLTQGAYFKSDYGLSYDESCFLRYDTTGKAAEEIFSDVIDLQGYDEIGMIVLDSSKALISMADLDNEFVKDNGQRASIAKSMGKFVRAMVQYLPKRNNILLVINQVTIEKEMFSTTYTESGGYSLRFFPSVKIRFGTRTFTAPTATGLLKTDISSSKAQSEYADKVNGMQFHYVVVKNRTNIMTNAGGFITVKFGKGIDRVYDFLEVIETAKILFHPSPRTEALVDPVTGEILKDKVTGRDLQFSKHAELENYLEENKDFFDEYYFQVLDFLCGKKENLNLLDQNVVAELMDQEAQIMKDIPTEAAALAADGLTEEDLQDVQSV